VEGTKDDALNIIWELFEFGLNVMTSKSSEPGDVVLFVDTKRFTIR
jgi:hypothetical protein